MSKSFSSSSPAPAPLLALPLELRLHMYSYLIQPTLNFNHCAHLSQARLPRSKNHPRPSPLKSYLTNRRQICNWCRSHGLHLPLTSRQLRAEFGSILHRMRPRLIVHCPDCLERLLAHFVRDLGYKKPLLKEFWVRPDFREDEPRTWMRFRPTFSLKGVRRDMKWVVGRWYGDPSLLIPKYEQNGEIDGDATSDDLSLASKFVDDERDRDFVADFVKIIGKSPLVSKQKRKRSWDDTVEGSEQDDDGDDDDADMDISEDESAADNDTMQTDDDDDDDGGNNTNINNVPPPAVPLFNFGATGPLIPPLPPFIPPNPATTASTTVSREYFRDPSVVEVERQSKRYHLDQPRDLHRAIECMWATRFPPEPEEDWWRRSLRLTQERGEQWVCREEVWVGCVMR